MTMRSPALFLAILTACRPALEVGPAPVVEARRPVEILSFPDEGPLFWVEVVVGMGSSRDPVGREGLAALTWLAATDTIPEGVVAWEPGLDAEHAWLRAACDAQTAQACLDGVLTLLTTGPTTDALLANRQAHLDLLEAPGREISDWLWQSWAYQGHPYGHPTPGRAGVLGLIGPEQALAFHRAQVVRENVRVGLAGPWTEDQRSWLADALLALEGERAPEAVWFSPPTVSATEVLHVYATPGSGQRLTLGRPLDLEAGQADWMALLVAHEVVARRLSTEPNDPSWPPSMAPMPVDPRLSWSDPALSWTVDTAPDRLPEDLVRSALDALRLAPEDGEIEAALAALELRLASAAPEVRLHLSLSQPWVAELTQGPLRVATTEVRAAWEQHIAEQPQLIVVRATADALRDGVVVRVPWSGEDAEPWVRIEPEDVRRLPPEGVLR